MKKKRTGGPVLFVVGSISFGALALACTTTPPGSGRDLYGSYTYSLEGLYGGVGSFSIQDSEGECEGWITLPGSGPGG